MSVGTCLRLVVGDCSSLRDSEFVSAVVAEDELESIHSFSEFGRTPRHSADF